MIGVKEVHSDSRRKITLVEGLLKEKREFTFIELNKGKAIGGCLHKDPEYFCVISGTIWSKVGDSIEILNGGQSGFIPNNYPHMFVGISDSIIIEWGVKSGDKNRKDKNMLREVETINGKN